MKKLIILAVVLLITACGEKPAEKQETPKNKSAFDVNSIFTKEEIKGAMSIIEAKKTAKVGESIIIKGEIGGKKKVFGESIATFLICDPTKVTSCDKKEGDDCETPWDYCCHDSDEIAGAMATVKLTDENGKILKINAKGKGGLKELSNIIIKGKVAKGSVDGVLIITAESIYIEIETGK